MSKYRWSILIAGIALILVGFGGYSSWMLLILLLWLTALAVGSYRIQSNFYLRSINQARTDEKSVVLSFDDGPCPSTTPLVLDVLKEYNCQAVFFCIGSRIAGNEAILQRMVAEGHLVANHSFSHSPWFDLYSSNRMRQEIQDTNEAIFRATGVHNRLFRPPYGVTNPMLARALRRSGLISIGWNIRSLDTVIRDTERVLNRIIRRLKPGSIILLHDPVAQSPTIVKELLAFLRTHDYRVERLDNVIDLT